jgi:hypothetical protein
MGWWVFFKLNTEEEGKDGIQEEEEEVAEYRDGYF